MTDTGKAVELAREALRVANGNGALALLLLPSLEDAAYNREYEAKGLSAWESPEYRPYCLNCRTMRRMEHRAFGYECSKCHAKCGPKGEDIPNTNQEQSHD